MSATNLRPAVPRREGPLIGNRARKNWLGDQPFLHWVNVVQALTCFVQDLFDNQLQSLFSTTEQANSYIRDVRQYYFRDDVDEYGRMVKKPTPVLPHHFEKLSTGILWYHHLLYPDNNPDYLWYGNTPPPIYILTRYQKIALQKAYALLCELCVNRRSEITEEQLNEYVRHVADICAWWEFPVAIARPDGSPVKTATVLRSLMPLHRELFGDLLGKVELVEGIDEVDVELVKSRAFELIARYEEAIREFCDETPTQEYITEALCDRQNVLGSEFHLKLGIMEAVFGQAQFMSLLSEYDKGRPWWRRGSRMIGYKRSKNKPGWVTKVFGRLLGSLKSLRPGKVNESSNGDDSSPPI